MATKEILDFTYEEAYTARANSSVNTGKWYWEITIDAGIYWDSTFFCIGVGTDNVNNKLAFSETEYGWGIDSQGRARHAGITVGTVLPSYRDANLYGKITIGIALDMDSGYMWAIISDEWGKYDHVGDPVTGTSPHLTGITGTVFPMVSLQYFGDDENVEGSAVITANFGKTPFKHGLPSGYQIIEGPSSSSSSSKSSSSTSSSSSSSNSSSSSHSSSSKSSSSSSSSLSTSSSSMSSSSYSYSLSSSSSSLSCLIPENRPKVGDFAVQIESEGYSEEDYPKVGDFAVQIESEGYSEEDYPKVGDFAVQIESEGYSEEDYPKVGDFAVQVESY